MRDLAFDRARCRGEEMTFVVQNEAFEGTDIRGALARHVAAEAERLDCDLPPVQQS